MRFARENIFVSLFEQVPGECRASIQFERFGREMLLQQFLARYLFLFLSLPCCFARRVAFAIPRQTR